MPYNLAYGCKGTLSGDGIVVDPRAVPFRDFFRGMAVEPRSLFDAQLRARRGDGGVLALAKRPIGIADANARTLTAEDVPSPDAGAVAGQQAHALDVRDGTFVIGDQPAWTEVKGFSWFQAQIPPALAAGVGPAITRFAPGRYGPGLTDDLADVVAGLKPGGVFVQHYGLWYDRRRVNHDYDGSAERRTGDAWAPFMELPWARSGEGKAWDGLSTYDLTRFNPWYFDRVASFADLARQHGRVLYHHFYFQHWVLESRAHYVDFPWRPVNAVQATDMPDQVPAANAFYDVTHPVRRDLHRRYIRHTLDVLGASQNVVFGLDREYTGSLAFVQFWLDTIADWQREHGRSVFVALEIPKAQMDAILDDPARRPLVTAVGFHHWVYRPDGVLFSVRGGIDKAPREQAADIVSTQDRLALGISDPAFSGDAIVNAPAFQQRQRALWATTPAMRYRAWREYRDRSASLVVLGQADPNPTLSRAVDAAIPAAVRQRLRPVDAVQRDRDTVWAIGAAGDEYVVYSMVGRPVVMDVASNAATFEVTWVDGVTGATRAARTSARAGEVLTLTPPSTGQSWVAWIRRAM